MRFNNLEEWLQWQEESHFTGINLSLERCAHVAKDMKLLDPNFTIVSVAGTNGKGSTITMLDHILTNSGYKTGCYTSPHLVRYNERIKLSGVEVTDNMLCESFARVDEARKGISLTYFEFGTLAALDIFHAKNIDIALLEVGLGGRLDAVNIVDANIALISSIGLDHTQWLGNDVESIAREKAGIFRHNKLAVCSDPAPPKSILQCANQVGTKIYMSSVDFSYHLSDHNWLWRYGSVVYESLPKPSQYNTCQVQNAAGALMVLHLLEPLFEVSLNAIIKGLQDFNPSGRFQILKKQAQIIFDVAHNVQATKMLMYNLQQVPNNGNTHIIIGMLKEKDHKGILSTLLEVANYWYTVSLPTKRSSDSSLLKELLLELGATVPVSDSQTVANAFTKIHNKINVNDRIVVTGSFISVSEAIKYLDT